MKKFLTLLLGITLAYSCSTSNDGNGNSTTTEVPVAPSNLTGVVASTTQINLSWTDNSTNETGFKIERKTGTGTYVVIGTIATDVTTYSDASLTQGTTYTYRVYSFNAVGNSPTYSNEFTLTTASVINLPSLTTTAVSSITTTTAVSGGTVLSDGGASITAKGVCWSTSFNPTISLTTRTNDGTGSGAFTSNLIGLIANTTYYIRAYATNSVGTAYGNELNFTTSSSQTSVSDIDGNNYQLVTICNQTWTKANLNVSKYRNGDIIPQVSSPTQLQTITSGAWCYYNNDSAYGSIYGKMYNWYAVNDPRGLAPTGYHIPSLDEWIILRDCLGGQLIAGGKMKEAGTSHWNSPNVDASNSSGFTGLPGGGEMFPNTNTNVNTVGNIGMFWSSTTQLNTPTPNSDANVISLFRSGGNWNYSSMSKGNVASVRCVKD